MNMREEVLSKQQEFAEYINNVDLDKLYSTHTRAELDAFQKSLDEIKLESLTMKLTKMIDKKKKEEYPELNSIHHYPALNQVDFLTLSEKEELDKRLAMYQVGNAVYNLYQVVRNPDKLKRLEVWLIENEILNKSHILLCPHCTSGNVSNLLTSEQKDMLIADFTDYKNGFTSLQEVSKSVESQIEEYCGNCDETVEISEFSSFRFKETYYLCRERDTRLDNV